jgi:outer membrane protein OmpA-like peptidoglycan-associated protein
MKATSDMSLRIVGHTCNLGSQNANLEIGLKRATTVKNMFLKQGVSESQLYSETKSFDDPLLPNTSSMNRIQNRRVTLVVE